MELDIWMGSKAQNRSSRGSRNHIEYEGDNFLNIHKVILYNQDDYEKQINKFSKSLQDELATIFNKYDNEDLVASSSRVDVIESNTNIFVQKTAPQTMDDLVVTALAQ